MVSLPRPRQTAPSGPPQREYRAIYYRQHGRKCSSKSHREWRTLGYCLWPRAVWVVGQGEWASVSYCRAGSTSVMFHPTEHDARQALEFIDHYACGGRCSRNHALVRIAPHLHPAGWHS